MHPFEPDPEMPAVRPSLGVRLRSGWRLDRTRRALVPSAGRAVSLRKVLPRGTKVVPVVPELDPATARGADEQLLARSVQVIFPEGTDPGAYAAALRALDGVESVERPPVVGLP
jgi:hypothetical protein